MLLLEQPVSPARINSNEAINTEANLYFIIRGILNLGFMSRAPSGLDTWKYRFSQHRKTTFFTFPPVPHHPDSNKFRELVVDTTVESVSRDVRSPGRLGSHRD